MEDVRRDERYGQSAVDAALTNLKRLNEATKVAQERKDRAMKRHEESLRYKGLRQKDLVEGNRRLEKALAQKCKELEEARKLNDQLTDRIYHLKRILSRTVLIAREALSGWRRLQTVYGNYLDRTENDAL